MKIINPSTHSVIREIDIDNSISIARKTELLKKGQEAWKNEPISRRLKCLTDFGSLISKHIDELALILTSETGKPISQSYNEINGAQNRITHLNNNAEKWLADETFPGEDTTGIIRYEALGVIANISAWNFPYNVGYNVFLYALAGGNAVMYKPSEYATLTGLSMTKYLHEAGIPEDVFQCVVGDGQVGSLMLDQNLDGYFFTGSYKTGKLIAQKVAEQLVPVQLELGGKDPLYVADDVKDIKQSAANAAEGAFYNNGQSCCAVERIYVHAAIYDEFVEAFLNTVNDYIVGDPTLENTYIGPVTRASQIAVLEEQVNDAINKGALLCTGGKPLDRPGNFFSPAVLTQVDHSMSIMVEESFGPVIGIQKVNNDAEALALMKDTSYGLTSAVFSSNRERAENLLKDLDTGTCYWNCCDMVNPDLPWSGRKNSGLGSTLSHIGIRAFVQPKSWHLRG
jgi:acyl-CoA reductase-like NAD-dependent aldehyde dehydrogenase